jgi:hypothetical protein
VLRRVEAERFYGVGYRFHAVSRAKRYFDGLKAIAR